MKDNSTWFYLNKQAAFVDVVALCNEANESALGPVKVVLESNDIEKTIETLTSDWFTPKTVKKSLQFDNFF